MKPILFSTPMVQAILEGKKNMTRRVMKDCTQFDIEESQLLENNGYNLTHNYKMSIESVGIFSTKEKLLNWFVAKYSKYQVGDVLWVRETWTYGRVVGESDEYGNSEFWLEQTQKEEDEKCIFYKADMDDAIREDISFEDVIWKPSIFMPKEACRIFLRVTNVRVERLQNISEEDCLKEGMPIEEKGLDVFLLWWMPLWNSTAKEGYKWGDNPWVFVYTFQRIEKPKEMK